MQALSSLSLNADAALTALSRERASRTLLHALASFASGLLKSHRLRELNLALNGKSLEEVLGYYQSRPELAKYTIDVELPRMEYRVRTSEGDELSTAEQIREYYESLPEKAEVEEEGAEGAPPAPSQTHILWRLANQSLLADVIAEMMIGGYSDSDLQATLRATSVKFVLDFGAQQLRVTAAVGVFIPAPPPPPPPVPPPPPPPSEGAGEEGAAAATTTTADAPPAAAAATATGREARGAGGDDELCLVRLLAHCEIRCQRAKWSI